MKESTKYIKFIGELPNENEECWEVIKGIRQLARSMTGPRICYEHVNQRGGIYALLIPARDTDERTLLIYEDLGISIVKVGHLSRKRRRECYNKIRL